MGLGFVAQDPGFRVWRVWIYGYHSVLRVHDIALVHNDRLGVSAPLGDEGGSQLACHVGGLYS